MKMRNFTMTHELVAARRKAQKAFIAARESKREFNTVYGLDTNFYRAYDLLHAAAHKHPYANAWHDKFFVEIEDAVEA